MTTNQKPHPMKDSFYINTLLAIFCCACFCGGDDEAKKREEDQQKKNEEVRSNSKDVIKRTREFIAKKDFGNAQRLLNDLKKANVQGEDVTQVESFLNTEKNKYETEQTENNIQALIPQIEKKLEEGEGIAAFELLQTGYKLVPEHPSLKPFELKIAPIKKEQEAKNRKDKIDQSLIIAKNTIKNKKSCQELPTELKSTFEMVKANVKKGDESYSKATKVVAGLENCRKLTIKQLNKTIENNDVMVRKAFAKSYENNLLDQGVDARVNLSGAKKDHIKITFILINRVLLRQIEKDGELLAKFKKAGFKKATFSDGYNDSWYYDLEPNLDRSGLIFVQLASIQAPFMLE
jgi:hypothetical protein